MSKSSPLNLAEAFAACEEEHLKFERIAQPPHRQQDLCAMLKFVELDVLAPGENSLCGAWDDDLYFKVDAAKLARVATLDDVVYLARCGVRFGSAGGWPLSLFAPS